MLGADVSGSGGRQHDLGSWPSPWPVSWERRVARGAGAAVFPGAQALIFRNPGDRVACISPLPRSHENSRTSRCLYYEQGAQAREPGGQAVAIIPSGIWERADAWWSWLICSSSIRMDFWRNFRRPSLQTPRNTLTKSRHLGAEGRVLAST